MTDHPITPPPELLQQWINEEPGIFAEHIATRAAQWGADQELEACCEWLVSEGWFKYEHEAVEDLCTARRPKPPSLKEHAQAELDRLIALIPTEGAIAMAEPIRRALEALPE
jgi:hypothetical protein